MSWRAPIDPALLEPRAGPDAGSEPDPARGGLHLARRLRLGGRALLRGRLGLRGPRRRPRPTRRPAGVPDRRRGHPGGARPRRATSVASTTPAVTAATSSWSRGPHATCARSSARTTHGSTSWTARLGAAPRFGDLDGLRQDRLPAGRGAHPGVERLDLRQRRRARPRPSTSTSATSRSRSRAWEPDRLFVAATHEYVIEANWKTITENYHECYHCPSIHPALCVVTPPDSGENYPHDGLWVGRRRWCSRTSPRRCRSPASRDGVPIARSERRAGARGLLHRPVPEPAHQPAPRLRHDAPLRAAGPGPQQGGVSVAVPARGQGPARASRPTTPASSGTSRTARTGSPASPSTGACSPRGSARGRSPGARTRSTSSWRWSRRATSTAFASTPAAGARAGGRRR